MTSMQTDCFPSRTLSSSPEETFQAGRRLGACLRRGDVVALSAPLGAGKTVFAKGIAEALGVGETVTSPSYTLVNEYDCALGVLYHIDTYRLSGCDDFKDIGGAEILGGNGICVIEWSERIAELLPAGTIVIKINILEGGGREINHENRT